MQFDILTIFPNLFDPYFNISILKKAQEKKKIKINIHDLRKWTTDKHRTVDDKPYGGGPGMILKVEPILKAVNFIIKKNKKIKDKERRIILLSAKGKEFTQFKARKLAKFKEIILICGHYEGVDERVAKYIADEEISIGKYILTGGELPAMVIVDAVSRLIPGVIKNESLKEETFSRNLKFKEYPQYTRPEIIEPKKILRSLAERFLKKKVWKVPKILLSGHHQKIREWRRKQSKNS